MQYSEIFVDVYMKCLDKFEAEFVAGFLSERKGQ